MNTHLGESPIDHGFSKFCGCAVKRKQNKNHNAHHLLLHQISEVTLKFRNYVVSYVLLIINHFVFYDWNLFHNCAFVVFHSGQFTYSLGGLNTQEWPAIHNPMYNDNVWTKISVNNWKTSSRCRYLLISCGLMLVFLTAQLPVLQKFWTAVWRCMMRGRKHFACHEKWQKYKAKVTSDNVNQTSEFADW